MKRLLVAFAVAAVLPAAPAVADYGECMWLCMSQQPFKACHDICKELATEAPAAGTNAREAPATPDAGTGSPAAAPEAAESLPPIPDVLKGWDCSGTRRKKGAALSEYIWKTYDPLESVMFPLRESQEAFHVGIFQRDKQRYCQAWIEITDDCRVSVIARARSDLLLAQRPLFSENPSETYFVKVEHGEIMCVFATE